MSQAKCCSHGIGEICPYGGACEQSIPPFPRDVKASEEPHHGKKVYDQGSQRLGMTGSISIHQPVKPDSSMVSRSLNKT
jgi:hypothetical protein